MEGVWGTEQSLLCKSLNWTCLWLQPALWNVQSCRVGAEGGVLSLAGETVLVLDQGLPAALRTEVDSVHNGQCHHLPS